MGKLINEKGNRYGKLLVLDRDMEPHTKPYWICQCDCGSEPFSVYGNHLRSGKTTQCKQCANKQGVQKRLGKVYEELIGKQFNNLTVIEADLSKGNKAGEARYWKCKCKCGNIISIPTTSILQEKIFSCGCARSKGEEIISQILTENQIYFEKEKTFDSCRFEDTKRKAKFDFYLPQNNTIIEYDGKQHYINTGGFFTEEEVEKIKQRDEYKNQWCKNNKINLIRIPYYDGDKITLQYLEERIKDYER